MAGPLQGINVLDMGTAAVGPWSATLLAWLGANVIKLEPPFGDTVKTQEPFQRGYSVSYTFCNLGKRCAVLDLRDGSNWASFERLVREADVLVENQRAGSLARLGVTFEALQALNPGIIYVTCPGFGYEGPMWDWPSADRPAQAFSGFGSLSGPPGGPGEMVRTGGILDFNASAYIATGVLLGLLHRERTGLGLWVKLSQVGNGIAVQITRVGEYLATGETPMPMGTASASTVPHQAFLCQDRRYLAVGVVTDAQWQGLCKALGREDLAQDSRFATNLSRVQNRHVLISILEEVFQSKPARWWAIQLQRHGVPYSYFYDFESLQHHSHYRENNLIPEIDIPHIGRMRFCGLPWEFSRTPGQIRPSAYPGQHTAEVLTKGFGSLPRASHIGQRDGQKVSRPPLEGLKVVDCTQGLSGPYASLLMADCGAEVIKVEPPEGDYSRGFAPQVREGVSAAFLQLNRNKKGLALDLSLKSDRKRLRDLLQEADVFLVDWYPDLDQDPNLGYPALEKVNPRLVYCAISPFGEKGPFSDLPGSELVVQAMAGCWQFVGQPGAPPLRWGADIASFAASLFVLQGVLAALFYREQHGAGQRIGVSLLGALNCYLGLNWAETNNPDEWNGHCQGFTSPPWRGIRVKDGAVFLSFSREMTEEGLMQLIRDLGMEEALSDPRFQMPAPTLTRRIAGTVNSAPEVWGKFLGSMTVEEVVQFFQKYGSHAVPLNNLSQALSHPQIKTLAMVKELDDRKLGQARVVLPPWRGPWPEPLPAWLLPDHPEKGDSLG
ncbi:MAG: CoA transferase [Chloroflexi bacterium]|nr:CoA transferase [Chloroflexota bacterium]